MSCARRMRMRASPRSTRRGEGGARRARVLTGDDLRQRGLGTLRPLVPRKRRNGSPAFVCPQPLLADRTRVRYVGDPVAFIVAETLNQAKDAAELIEVDYEPLPAVIARRGSARARRARGVGRQPRQRGVLPRSRQQGGGRCRLRQARRISSSHRIVINRITANTMEPRGCLAQYDADDERYTIRCTIQSAHGTSAALAEQIFKVPHNQLRVRLRQYGRRLRHEGRLLSRIRAVAVGGRGHRPPGALDRRAQRRHA